VAENVSTTDANAILAAMLQGTAYAGHSGLYVQLHTGAPGAAGTSNVAGNNTRQAVGAFSAPSGGSSSNSAAINWTSVSTSETYAKVSLWTAASGGSFVASGSITAAAITAGQNFQIPAGGMTVSLPVAG
jgi:hypothetical protein